MVEKYCQSCGIPMGYEQALYGDNQNGSLNHDYCMGCFQKGAFTNDITLEQMINVSLIYQMEVHPDADQIQVKKDLEEKMSQLKRWKEAK